MSSTQVIATDGPKAGAALRRSRGRAPAAMLWMLSLALLSSLGMPRAMAQSLPGEPPTRTSPTGEDALPPAMTPAAPARMVALPEGREAREGETVTRVQISGNRRVEADTILRQVRTKPGEPLKLEALSQDLRRVYELGYFDDIAIDARVTAQDELLVTFIVTEKPAIDAIRYVGNTEISTDDISEVVDLKRFAILDPTQVNAAATKIRDLYADKGFFLAEVTFDIASQPGRPDLAVVTFKVEEYAKIEVRKVTILGNKAVGDEELRNIMATREGHWLSFLTSFGTFKERDFETDLQRLTAYYYDKGYVQVAVTMPTIRISPDRRYLYISVHIEEGPLHTTGTVDVQGDLLEDREKALERVTLKPGETFSYGTMRRDIEALRTQYQDAGHAWAQINPLTRIDPRTNVVDVAYDIKKGALVNVGRIQVVGNTKTRDAVIRRELRLAEGDLYSASLLEQSRARVERLGFFERVSVSTQRGAREDLIDVQLEVVERATGTFQIGAGFSSTESLMLNAQISQNNLFGRGQSLSLNLQRSNIRTMFNIQFMEPYFQGSPWQLSVDLYNYDLVYQGFSRRSTGGNTRVGYPVTDSLTLALAYKLEDVGVTPTAALGSNAQQTALFDDGVTSSLRLSAFFDERNNRLFPTAGHYHTAEVELADDWTLSQNEFVKTDWESRVYVPLFWELVLRLRGSVGYIATLDEARPVPVFERYFVGGPTTVRGFERYALGPARRLAGDATDPASGTRALPIGGNKRLMITAEVEVPIFRAANITGVVFADAGNAFGEDEDLTLVPDLFLSDANDYVDALRTSMGFGFRWFSPIGPLRFEWGVPLQRLRGEKPLVFDFSIQQGF